MNKSFPAKGKGASNARIVARKAGEKPGIRNRKLEKHFNLKPILTSTSETSTTETSGVSSSKTTSRSDSETSGSETSGSDSTRFSPHYNSLNDENVSKMKKPMAILCFISNNLLKNLDNNDDKEVEEEEEIEEGEDYSSDTSNTSRASSSATSVSDFSGDASEMSQRSPSTRTSSVPGKSQVRFRSSSPRKQHQTGNDIRYPPKVIPKCQGHTHVYKSRVDSLVASLDLEAGGDSSQKHANNKLISRTEDVKDRKQKYIRRGAEPRAGGSRSSCGRKKVSFSVDDEVEDEIEEMITPAHEEKMLHFTSKFDGKGGDRGRGRVSKRFIFTKVR